MQKAARTLKDIKLNVTFATDADNPVRYFRGTLNRVLTRYYHDIDIPANDREVTSAKLDGVELVGETFPKNPDFMALMGYVLAYAHGVLAASRPNFGWDFDAKGTPVFRF